MLRGNETLTPQLYQTQATQEKPQQPHTDNADHHGESAADKPAAYTNPLYPKHPIDTINEDTPIPSFQPQNLNENNKTEQSDNGTIIQDEGHNPWL